MKRMILAAGAVLLSGANAIAAQADTAAASPPAVTASSAQTAWEHYRDTLTRVHAGFLASEQAKDPELRAQGLYLLQSLEVMAFNSYVAPRQLYPALYVPYPPLELSWGMTNPDFFYRQSFIDGARTYRIWGNRRGNRWATLQVMKGFLGDSVQGTLANVDFDDLPTTTDGSFEIFLGPNPPADARGKYWVRLDPSLHNNMLTLRETLYDWSKEEPMELHIEALDRPPSAPVFFDEDELAARIDRAAKFVEGVFTFTMASAGSAQRSGQELNRFYGSDAGRQQGGSPLGYWVNMQYEIGDDDALLIEMPVIEARYWGFQLGTVWGQTIDFTYHNSSINGLQARVDRDGTFRAILSLRDPGVPNWLDPAGLRRGSALLRFYKAKNDAHVVPTVRKIRFSEIGRYLPQDTGRITPEQRAAIVALRRTASLRRYGQ